VKRLASIVLILAFATPARAEVVDRVVAVVNDEPLTEHDIREERRIFLESFPGEARRDPMDLRKILLDKLIEDRLREEEAEAAGIAVSEEEIDRLIADIRRDSGITEEQLRETLEREGLAYDDYRETLADQIQMQKLMGRALGRKVIVTPEVVEEYYDQHIDRYMRDPKVRIAGLFLVVSGLETDEELAAKARRIEEIHTELEAGAEFERLVAMYSEGPRPKRGGVIGAIPAGDLAPEFKAALEGVPEGGHTEPFRTAQAFVILKHLETMPSEPIPLDDIRGRVEREAQQAEMSEAFEEWMARLKANAQIEIIEPEPLR